MNDTVYRFAVHHGYINYYYRWSIHIGLNHIGIKERDVSTSRLYCFAIHEVNREKNLTKEMVFNFDVIFLQREAVESWKKIWLDLIKASFSLWSIQTGVVEHLNATTLTQSSPSRSDILCNFLLSEYKKILRKLCVMVWFFIVGFRKYMRSVCFRGTPHPGGVPRVHPRQETEPSRSSNQHIFIHGSRFSKKIKQTVVHAMKIKRKAHYMYSCQNPIW